jgi:hypothetical protein
MFNYYFVAMLLTLPCNYKFSAYTQLSNKKLYKNSMGATIINIQQTIIL